MRARDFYLFISLVAPFVSYGDQVEQSPVEQGLQPYERIEQENAYKQQQMNQLQNQDKSNVETSAKRLKTERKYKAQQKKQQKESNSG